MKIVAACLLILLLSACASGGRPAWVNGEDKRYPESGYLTAGGSAAKPEDAQARALANLAKIFEVRIDDAARDESAAWRETSGDTASQGSSQLTLRYIDTYTTKLLEGARIAESWRDDATGQHHALAVISRKQLSARLGDDIRKLDRHSQTLIADASRTPDPFKSAQLLYQARIAQVDRAAIQRDLQIVDPTGVGIRPLWTPQDLDARIDAELAKMTVSSRTPADAIVDINAHLQSGIRAAGMLYRDAGAAYRLDAALDVQDVGLQDGWYWYRGALELRLLHGDAETALATIRWPLKTAGQSRAQAEIRLKDEILALLGGRLKTALLGNVVENTPPQSK